MPLDSNNFFTVGLTGPTPPVLPGNYSGGNPEGVVLGSVGDEVYDPATGTFYWKQSGTATTTGWIEKLTLPS